MKNAKNVSNLSFNFEKMPKTLFLQGMCVVAMETCRKDLNPNNINI